MALQDLTPQLRTRLGRAERLVGLFLTLACLLSLAGFVYYLRHAARERGWFVPSVPYYTYIKDATGIQAGAAVKMMGFTIGEVTRVDHMPMEPWYVDNGFFVFVAFEVRAPYFGFILTDSRVRLGAGDLLGTRSLEVLRGRTGRVTVTNEFAKHPAVLSDKYAYEGDAKKKEALLVYRTREAVGPGYYLTSEEQLPLPEKLTLIANDLHAALPGVLALTNRVDEVVGQIRAITAKVDQSMPALQSALAEVEGLLKDARPLLQKPGGVGELLIPPGLNAELTLTLSNLNSRSELVGPTLSNLNALVVGLNGTAEQIRSQLARETNLVGNVNRLADQATALVETTDTLLKRHWLFRSAFKTNAAKERAGGKR